MTAHSSIVGGSTAARVLRCPASIELVAPMPQRPAGAAAETGTACHEAMEWLFSDERQPDNLEGLIFNERLMTKDRIGELIVPCYDYVNAVIDDCDYYLEITSEFPGLSGAFGTADVVVLAHDHTVHILDYKFGAGPVKVKGNIQLRFYAACVRAYLKKKGIEVAGFELHILQPKLDYFEREYVSLDELDAFEIELRHVVTHRHEKNLPVAGDHCRFCPAKPVCPAHITKAEEAVALDDLAEARLPYLLDLADDYLKWAKAVHDLAHEVMIDHTRPIDGWKVVEKQGRRAWEDEETADRYLARQGFKVEARRKTATVSPAQAEKLLKTKGKKLPEHLFDKKSAGLTVVRESNPKPAVMVGDDRQVVVNLLKRRG